MIGYTNLVNFGKRLRTKTKLYRKYIAIKDPRKERSLQMLEYIANQLIQCQFDSLIEHSDELISYDPNDQVEIIKDEEV